MSKTPEQPTELGRGVCAYYLTPGAPIVLFSEKDHENRIVLEPETMDALLAFVRQVDNE